MMGEIKCVLARIYDVGGVGEFALPYLIHYTFFFCSFLNFISNFFTLVCHWIVKLFLCLPKSFCSLFLTRAAF